ncbi:MAG: hypothetical protein ABUS79_17150 [Pseudomonadota bacterium]
MFSVATTHPRGDRAKLLFARWSWAVTAVVVIAAGPAVAAVPGEPARLRAAASLIDDVVRGLLPLDVVLPGPIVAPDAGVGQSAVAASITELRYCGATDKGAGRFRAVLRWGATAGAGSSSPTTLGGDDGCRQGLGELAKQLPGAAGPDDGVVVAEIEAVWRPWDLRLAVVRAAGPAAPKPGQPRPLAPWESRRDLLLFSTAGLRVITDTGEPLTLHVAPSFTADAVDLAAVWGETGSAPPATRPAAAGGGGPTLSPNANVAGDLPLAFANQILRQLTSPQPLAVPIDRDVIDVQGVALAGVGGGGGVGTGGLTVTGSATPRSLRETARVTVQVGGGETRVLSIRADAQMESCSGLGVLAALACNTRNAGRNAAAGAFGAAMTQRYQGQAVRDLAGPQVFRFDVGGRRLELRGELSRMAAGARGLAATARLTTGDGGASPR